MRRLVMAITFGVAVAGMPLARADEANPWGNGDGMGRTALVLELLIPDFRVEHSFTFHATRWTAAVPFAVQVGHLGPIAFNTVAEIQYVIGDSVWRGSLGERLMFRENDGDGRLMPIVELTGVYGQDGYGGALGLGYVYGFWTQGASFGVIGRAVVTDRDRRADLALDLQIPFNSL